MSPVTKGRSRARGEADGNSIPGAAPPLTPYGGPVSSVFWWKNNLGVRLLEWKSHLDALAFYLLADLLYRSPPGKFVGTDMQTRALQHLLCPSVLRDQKCHFGIMQILETVSAYRGQFDSSGEMRGFERKKKVIRGSLGRFLSRWCCRPACVNDFLKWRPGPTLCGNQQS